MRQKKTPRKKLHPDELSRMIRIAALHLDPKGRIEVLAEKAGFNPETIRKAIRDGYFSPGLACAIECAVGVDVLPKGKLCPSKFTN